MTNAKHIPGPWRVDDHPREYPRVTDARSRFVADCNSEADARLVAAAPELLAVAQLVANIGEYRALVEQMSMVLRPHERETFVRLFRTQAKAAIAKATGENNENY